MSSVGRIVKFSVFRKTASVPRCLHTVRSISTSNKKDDTTTVVGPSTTQENTSCEPKKKRFFYDYGFGGKTEEEEHNRMNASCFMYITVAFVGTGFLLAYRPDNNLHDWAQREAYLELRRREKLGLPLIDPNYVDPSTVHLPSDEELGDTEVII